MMCYEESVLKEIRESPEFREDYEEYKKGDHQVNELKTFIDSIQLNSKYFRLTMNTKGGNRKKFKNRNLGEDTVAIKEVNSYLNKLTDRNVNKVTDEIQKRLVERDYLRELIFP